MQTACLLAGMLQSWLLLAALCKLAGFCLLASACCHVLAAFYLLLQKGPQPLKAGACLLACLPLPASWLALCISTYRAFHLMSAVAWLTDQG